MESDGRGGRGHVGLNALRSRCVQERERANIYPPTTQGRDNERFKHQQDRHLNKQ